MIKRLFLLVLAALIVLAGVVLTRAARFTSKQVAVAPVAKLDVDLDQAVQRLSKAVTFKTVSYQDPAQSDASQFEGLHAFMEQSFPKVHATLKREAVGAHSLLYTWTGSDAALKPILLMAHQDVVPVVPGTESNWEQEPFGGAVVKGFIWGRGTLDDKISMFGILEAVEKLLAENKQPKRTVLLFFGHDEEVGGQHGAAEGAKLLASRGVKAEFVLDEGGAIVSKAMPGVAAPVATIGVAEKGYMSVRLTATADGGHSSQPPRDSAIGLLAQSIVRLRDHQMPGGIQGLTADMLGYIGPEMSFGMKAVVANLWLFSPLLERQFAGSPVMNAFMRTTTAPTIISGGSKENVLPPEATVTINFRILPGDTRDGVIAHIKRVVADERVKIEPIMETAVEASKVSPSSGPNFDLIARTVREVAPGVVTTPYLVLGGTDSRHFEPVSDNIYRFLPMSIESDDLKRMHGTNERIGVEAYGTTIRFYHRLLENAAM
jgi:carboxypeptidase PM20D1